jgi:hypothetical protein
LVGCFDESKFQAWNSAKLQRSVEGLLAALLSLKKKPLIRYDGQSAMCFKLASQLQVASR